MAGSGVLGSSKMVDEYDQRFWLYPFADIAILFQEAAFVRYFGILIQLFYFRNAFITNVIIAPHFKFH